MNIELINTGTELLLGRVLNTHQQWLCRRLTDLGYMVSRQECVPDEGQAIEKIAREALERSNVVIVTGGLGPTSDDITRDLIAKLLGRRLVLDNAVLSKIESFFKGRGRPMPFSTRVQAMVPEGARVLDNATGTAPGLALEVAPNPFSPGAGKAWLILLPGPPRELYPMFDEQVVPLLLEEAPPQRFCCHTLRSVGIGESVVEERIGPALGQLVASGLTIGYCARTGEVDVRLSARGDKADQLVGDAERIVRSLLGRSIFGLDDETMESVVVRLLTERGKRLGIAESCTGGFVAHRITNVPGASAVFMSGLVTYSNRAKETLLGVQSETLAEHGAVSEPVARQMAEGARDRLGVDYALSVTGIAGPSGGSPQKPVGTVYMAIAHRGGTAAERHFNPFERQTFKVVTSQQVLDLLRRTLLG